MQLFYKTITGDRFISAIIVILIAVWIWMPAFLSPEISIVSRLEDQMPLYRLLTMALDGNELLPKLVAFGLMLFGSFLLVRINAKFVLVQQKTFLPALFFILIASHSPDLLQWNPVLPATLFVILVLEIIFRSYSDEPNTYRFFNAGILLGLGSLFYAPLIYLLAFIWIACNLQRPFYWREYIFPILGFMVPYIFVLAYLFFGDKNIPEFLVTVKSNFIFEFRFPQYHWTYWILAIYLGLLVLISGGYLLKVFQFRKKYIRDYFKALIWLLFINLLVFMFLSGFDTGINYLLAISVSFIFTNYFINARKSIGNKVLLYLLLGYVVFLALNNMVGWLGN